MRFPMYTVVAETLLEMTEVRPHEDLKAHLRGSCLWCARCGETSSSLSMPWV